MNPADRIHPELHGLTGNRYYRAWQRKRRTENVAAGLTWDGRMRKRPIRFDLVGLSRSARKAITNRERAHRFIALGLTWTGRPRKRMA
jgi:hypothetical protein